MPQADKLRLADGSVIHLDRADLRSWYERGLIGDDTPIQTPGSNNWTSLSKAVDVRQWRAGGAKGGKPASRGRAATAPEKGRAIARAGLPSPWRKRLVMGGAVAAVLAAVVLSAGWWLPALRRWALAGASGVAAPAESPDRLQMGKQAAVEAAARQLPHLNAQTIERVMTSSAADVLDPPEVFRRAYESAGRGLPALAREESQELAALNAALAAGLSPRERVRLADYIDRVRGRRPTSPDEDAQMGRLVQRGVARLAPPQRERLQALFGKAVAAALDRPAAAP